MMRAITIPEPGGPDALTVSEVEAPQPGPGQLLIKVAAAGVNRPDVMQRAGTYPAPKGHSLIPGLEIAGRIAALGSGVEGFQVDDRVMALVNGGGYAEMCVAEASSTLRIPSELSELQAAGVPETFFTVWHNVFQRGRLTSGETFLVHGGTSGIGVTAIQLAKAFGATVIASAGSAAKCDAMRDLGADHVINYREQDFVEVVKTATEKRGVNVILDMVGGDYIARNIKCLADDGRLVNIAYQKGSKSEIDFLRVMLKRLTLTGSTLRIRSSEVKADIAREVGEYVVPLLQDGRVKVPVDRVFDLQEAAAAHAHLEAGQHVGKVILRVDPTLV